MPYGVWSEMRVCPSGEGGVKALCRRPKDRSRFFVLNLSLCTIDRSTGNSLVIAFSGDLPRQI
jgi:hypothetical protein